MPKVDDIFSDKIDNTISVIIVITSFLESCYAALATFQDL